jgi:hypothetical protein
VRFQIYDITVGRCRCLQRHGDPRRRGARRFRSRAPASDCSGIGRRRKATVAYLVPWATQSAGVSTIATRRHQGLERRRGLHHARGIVIGFTRTRISRHLDGMNLLFRTRSSAVSPMRVLGRESLRRADCVHKPATRKSSCHNLTNLRRQPSKLIAALALGATTIAVTQNPRRRMPIGSSRFAFKSDWQRTAGSHDRRPTSTTPGHISSTPAP